MKELLFNSLIGGCFFILLGFGLLYWTIKDWKRDNYMLGNNVESILGVLLSIGLGLFIITRVLGNS